MHPSRSSAQAPCHVSNCHPHRVQEDRSVISPHEAPLYYGAGGLAKDGWQEDGEDDGDLYHLTPYSQYPHR